MTMTTLIHIIFDGLSGVDGSARFSFGPTTALVSVSGPISPRLASSDNPVRATIDLHVRPISSVSRTPEKHVASALKGILERACILAQHPRTSIQVVVQDLSPVSLDRDVDKDLEADVRLAAEINAASLALLNAGSVPMRGVACAITVATSETQAHLVADLTPSHPLHSHSGCFAFLFGVDRAYAGTSEPILPSKMIWTNYRARPGNTYSLVGLADAEKVALEGAAAVWTRMKESLRASSVTGEGQ